jgi:hypothetical protein
MRISKFQSFILFNAFWLFVSFSSQTGFGQQIVQRGPFGKPSQVRDEMQQWSTPMRVASDKDVELYIPDLTNPEWFKRNYTDFQD